MVLKLERMLTVLVVALIVALFVTHQTSVVYGEEGLHVKEGGKVGIGTTSPSETLEVNGRIKVGNSSCASTAGTIRWTGTDFEGFNGTEWVSLTGAVANTEPPKYTDCINVGGAWSDIQGVCYFSGSSPPPGWTKKENYSSTRSNSCASRCIKKRRQYGTACSTGTHSRKNIATETCSYTYAKKYGSGRYSRCRATKATCTATQTEIGCVKSS